MGVSYPFAETQSVYSTASAYWADKYYDGFVGFGSIWIANLSFNKQLRVHE